MKTKQKQQNNKTTKTKTETKTPTKQQIWSWPPAERRKRGRWPGCWGGFVVFDDRSLPAREVRLWRLSLSPPRCIWRWWDRGSSRGRRRWRARRTSWRVCKSERREDEKVSPSGQYRSPKPRWKSKEHFYIKMFLKVKLTNSKYHLSIYGSGSIRETLIETVL